MKSARQEILDNLRTAKLSLPGKPDFSEPVIKPAEKPLELAFKKGLELVNGNVHLFDSGKDLYSFLKLFVSSYQGKEIYCDETDIKNQLTGFGIEYSSGNFFDNPVQIGITACEFVIAQTGSIMVSSAQTGGRKLFVYPEIHVVIAKKNQLVETLDEAYKGIADKYREKLPSQIVLITGPSRTADIEKTLTLGAHGPKELHVLLH
jgi:L-lactate dehydrogenase complex protein LldG